MAKVIIADEVCKGCGLCINVCPKKCLEPSADSNKAGYFAASFARPSDCIGCASCAIMCPDSAITVER